MKQIFAALIFAGCVFGVQAQEGTENLVMPSPEEARKEAQANTKYLAAQSLKKAKALLDAYGEFAPFGAGMFQEGEVKYVWAIKPGESTEGVNPVMVLNAVRRALSSQAQAGRILGSAVVYQYQKEVDGETQLQINTELEYLNGYAEVIATQYEQGEDGIEYTTSGSQSFEAKVFAGFGSTGSAEQ
ncbi:hypothetical protein [Marinobacter sp. CHS3-4]|uniref:hypothetical protein n=1 Tax=Marinobacter sp. CHS3-4 TaxID=3045174 RepID=UPI0024B60A4A|nr:hypothetical protein [Marinobacter sp. CHS3-4]MDI9245521.1 hypothetical protein [Marinobacter sp. CHS3-4]